MDLLKKIHGADNSLWALSGEISKQAEAIANVEGHLVKLLEVQGEKPDSGFEMEGRIAVGDTPMPFRVEIPISELIKAKRDEVDQHLNALNAMCVSVNSAVVRLKSFVPEPPTPEPPKHEDPEVQDLEIKEPEMPTAAMPVPLVSDDALSFGERKKGGVLFNKPYTNPFSKK